MQDKPSIRPSTTAQHIKLNLHAQTTNLSLTDVWGHAATYVYIYIYVTLHGKTDTNAFPLNGLEKRL